MFFSIFSSSIFNMFLILGGLEGWAITVFKLVGSYVITGIIYEPVNFNFSQLGMGLMHDINDFKCLKVHP